MASNTRIPKAEITGIFGFLLKTMSRKMFGHVPESVGVMWHYPAVLKDLAGFGRKVDKWDRRDLNLASFAAMAAAGVVGCSFASISTTSWDTTGFSTRPRYGRCCGRLWWS